MCVIFCENSRHLVFFKYGILCILLYSASKQWTLSKIRAMFYKKKIILYEKMTKNDKIQNVRCLTQFSV